MDYERILHLESIELENIIDIQLNVGSDENIEFRSLNKLSKGQQCTAILNLLTLSNDDPLLVDQEDGIRDTETQKQITSIEPLETQLSQVNIEIEKLKKERMQLKENLKEIFDEQLKNLNKCVKKINNNYLKGQVNIKIHPYANVIRTVPVLITVGGMLFPMKSSRNGLGS